MIRILDYIFNKDEVLYFEKVNYYVAEEYYIRVVLKNEDIIDMKFDDMYGRDETFAELIEKGDKDE